MFMYVSTENLKRKIIGTAFLTPGFFCFFLFVFFFNLSNELLFFFNFILFLNFTILY